jgi:hypothetical protein
MGTGPSAAETCINPSNGVIGSDFCLAEQKAYQDLRYTNMSW